MGDFFRSYGWLLALAGIVAMFVADCAGGTNEKNLGTIESRSMQAGYWEAHRATYGKDSKGRKIQTRAAWREWHPPHYYVNLTFGDDDPTTVEVTEDDYAHAYFGGKVHYSCRRGCWSGIRYGESYTQ